MLTATSAQHFQVNLLQIDFEHYFGEICFVELLRHYTLVMAVKYFISWAKSFPNFDLHKKAFM